MKDLIKKLNDFKEIEPDEKYWHVSRSILLNTVEADSSEQQGFQFKSLFFNMNIFARTVFPTMKVATISLVVMAMVFVTGLGAQASGPDDFLFAGKLMLEKGQLLLAKDSSKTEIYFEHINNRLEEIDKLIAEDKSDYIVKATKNIESSLQQVKENLELMKNNEDVDNHQVVKLATLIDSRTNEISETLKEKSTEVESTEMTETIKISDSLSRDALDVIVGSDTELADFELELIANSINNKIELQIDRFEGIGEKITQVQEGDSLVIEEDALDIETDLVTTSTINEDDDILDQLDEGQPLELNISEIGNIDSEEILNKLAKAQELLESGDYPGALRKLKEAIFYIDLTDEATDKVLENIYKDKIEALEQEIKEEVKGETEQVLE